MKVMQLMKLLIIFLKVLGLILILIRIVKSKPDFKPEPNLKLTAGRIRNKNLGFATRPPGCPAEIWTGVLYGTLRQASDPTAKPNTLSELRHISSGYST